MPQRQPYGMHFMPGMPQHQSYFVPGMPVVIYNWPQPQMSGVYRQRQGHNTSQVFVDCLQKVQVVPNACIQAVAPWYGHVGGWQAASPRPPDAQQLRRLQQQAEDLRKAEAQAGKELEACEQELGACHAEACAEQRQVRKASVAVKRARKRAQVTRSVALVRFRGRPGQELMPSSWRDIAGAVSLEWSVHASRNCSGAILALSEGHELAKCVVKSRISGTHIIAKGCGKRKACFSLADTVAHTILKRMKEDPPKPMTCFELMKACVNPFVQETSLLKVFFTLFQGCS